MEGSGCTAKRRGPLPFGTDITVRALQIVNWAMKVQIHVFFTSAADGDACSASATPTDLIFSTL